MKKNAWLFIMLLALIVLAFVLLYNINPSMSGKAFFTASNFQTATSIVLFGILKILVVFSVVFFIFFKERKIENK